MDNLEKAGFSELYQGKKGGMDMVVAVHRGAQFHFSVNPAVIKERLCENRKRITDETRRKIGEQANRIGWRLLAEQVKSTCDAVRYGALTITEAFAGYVLLSGPDGQPVKLAEQLTMMIESGALKRANSFQALLDGPKQ
jgi:hypothetical protein